MEHLAQTVLVSKCLAGSTMTVGAARMTRGRPETETFVGALQVGRDFLPRGTGICTRRPLVLHLRRSVEPPDPAQPHPEWAEFTAHLPGRKFTDFDEVRDEIDAETTRLLGNSDKDVSDKPIHLTIHSPHVLCASRRCVHATPNGPDIVMTLVDAASREAAVRSPPKDCFHHRAACENRVRKRACAFRTMSLVDLPGMTRVPVKGQPDDITAKLEALIMRYINNPACIILAVSAANSDLANSDAIALSRAADPAGVRTIGAPPPAALAARPM
jgi:dynamin 1-like protein